MNDNQKLMTIGCGLMLFGIFLTLAIPVILMIVALIGG